MEYITLLIKEKEAGSLAVVVNYLDLQLVKFCLHYCTIGLYIKKKSVLL